MSSSLIAATQDGELNQLGAAACVVDGQYAEWGLDLIKNDCVFASNWDESGSPLIRGVKRAIVRGGHPTIYSLSPGDRECRCRFLLFLVCLAVS